MARYKNPREKLNTRQWGKLRALWEAGEGTFEVLGKAFGISEQRIKNKSSKDGWIRNGLKEQVEQKAAETTAATIARLGMPKERLLKLFIQDAETAMDTRNIKEIAKGKDGKPIFMKNGRPLIVERSVSVIAHEIRLRNRQELLKLSNYYPAPKAAVDEPNAPDEPIPHVMDMKPVAFEPPPAAPPEVPSVPNAN